MLHFFDEDLKSEVSKDIAEAFQKIKFRSLTTDKIVLVNDEYYKINKIEYVSICNKESSKEGGFWYYTSRINEQDAKMLLGEEVNISMNKEKSLDFYTELKNSIYEIVDNIIKVNVAQETKSRALNLKNYFKRPEKITINELTKNICKLMIEIQDNTELCTYASKLNIIKEQLDDISDIFVTSKKRLIVITRD